jgi:four helix bundle protein
MVQKFEELECWRIARELTQVVYAATRADACRRDYGYCDQMRRAAVSVMNNVAEGFERGSNRDFVKFLYIARASAGEVRSMTYVGLDQGYISQETFDQLQALARRCGGLSWGLIKSLSKRLDFKSKLQIWLFAATMPLLHFSI